MNIYTIVAYAVVALIFIYRIKAGFKNGLVSELTTAVSVLGAVIIGYLIKYEIGDSLKEGLGVTISLILLILIVIVATFILKIILKTLRLFTWLPVIRGINKLLGAFAGIVEAFILVTYIVYLLKEWVM